VVRELEEQHVAALMRHLKAFDGEAHTVVMVQVENEIGMIPSARDHAPDATTLFAGAVPAELMAYLQQHAGTLAPELDAAWRTAGARRAGTWTEVFGEGTATDEIFMAWHFARFTQHVTAAGKAEYALPMFVNAALIRPGYQPGQYPSAGPLPHLIDVWRAGAPAIDFIAPDIYFPTFVEDATVRAQRQPALRSGSAPQPRSLDQLAVRVRRARRDRLLALRDRGDLRSGGDAARRKQ
jgi:beta-galactosidase GanA